MSQRPFVIGQILGSHGIKGDIRVFPLTDDIKRFELLKEVDVEMKGVVTPYEIEHVWYHKKFVMLKLRGVNTMNGAAALKGGQLKIAAELALPLSEGEYYVRDLIDMTVYTEAGELLGKITDVIPTGANDVYEIDKKLLIPAIKDCVKDVDIEGKKMVIRLLEGLI